MISPFIFICLFNDNGIFSHCDNYDKGDDDDDDDCDDYTMTIIVVVVVVVVVQEVSWPHDIQYPEFVLSKNEQNQTLMINIVFLDMMGLMW